MSDIVGTESDALKFNFEYAFEPYKKFMRNSEIDKIDLVVSDIEGPKIPYEIKLTVVPDSSTQGLAEKYWGPEIVCDQLVLHMQCWELHRD